MSLVLLIVSRRELGKSFSVRAEAKSLITTGIYSKIEHPLYTFLDFFLIGVILVLGLSLLLIAWGILVAVHVIEARREEKVLSDAFGAAYATYRSKTWF